MKLRLACVARLKQLNWLEREMKYGREAVQTCLYYVHTPIDKHERVCTMYLQIYEIMNMHVQLNEIMYTVCTYYIQLIQIYVQFMYTGIHVHTRS